MIRLRCPCGETIDAKDEDTLVEKAKEHLAQEHPHLVDEYTREQILFMAY
jgi:predicted small metal-binding protein